MTAYKVRSFVPGAPVQRGALVRVVRSCDETDLDEFIGKVGEVDYLEYTCGCGQSFPDDPMIGVKFDDGLEQEFWKIEVEQVRMLQ